MADAAAAAPIWAELMELGGGFALSQLLNTVVELHVAEQLGDTEQDIETLAKACGAFAENLLRVMRGLISRGIFAYGTASPRTVRNNERSQLLRRDAPQTIAYMVLHWNQVAYEPWRYLTEVVRDPNYHCFRAANNGRDVWDIMRSNEGYRTTFMNAMRSVDSMSGAVIGAYDFAQHPRIVDIGSSSGSFLVKMLATAPNTTGVMFDLPAVIAESAELWKRDFASFANRVTTEAGDFFKGVPKAKDGDLYVLRNILHDWPDEQCDVILRSIRTAIGTHSNVRLAIVEASICEPEHNSARTMIDLMMMVLLRAGERTESAFRAMLERAGFRLVSFTQTPSPMVVTIAQPV